MSKEGNASGHRQRQNHNGVGLFRCHVTPVIPFDPGGKLGNENSIFPALCVSHHLPSSHQEDECNTPAPNFVPSYEGSSSIPSDYVMPINLFTDPAVNDVFNGVDSVCTKT